MATIRLRPYACAFGGFNLKANTLKCSPNELKNGVAKKTHTLNLVANVYIEALSLQVREMLANGYDVQIPGLGIFKIGVESIKTKSVSEMTIRNSFKSLKVNFLPCKELKEYLKENVELKIMK